jgi:hypothetical protein
LISDFIDHLAFDGPTSEPDDLPERIRSFFKSYEWKYALALLTASFKHNGFAEEGE